MPNQDVPLSGIVALEAGTKLRVKPFGKSWCTVTLRAGDMLIFRGDLCHHGIGYKKLNTRLHFYIDSPLVRRIPNHVFGGCD